MNRGRLVARVAGSFGLSTDVGSDELTLLDEWAQEGVNDVLKKTRCRVELGNLSLSVGVDDYRVDQSVLAMEEVTVVGATYNPEIVTPEEIYEYRLAASVAAGDTINAIAFDGDLLMVWPTPTAIQTLRYIYVAKPSDMVDDASDPSSDTYGAIPVDLHECIEAFMWWKASVYDGTRAPLTPKDYREIYLDLCKDARKTTRQKGGRGLRPTRVGYPARRNPGRRNDTYPER